jgi:hypothetical protein
MTPSRVVVALLLLSFASAPLLHRGPTPGDDAEGYAPCPPRPICDTDTRAPRTDTQVRPSGPLSPSHEEHKRRSAKGTPSLGGGLCQLPREAELAPAGTSCDCPARVWAGEGSAGPHSSPAKHPYPPGRSGNNHGSKDGPDGSRVPPHCIRYELGSGVASATTLRATHSLTWLPPEPLRFLALSKRNSKIPLSDPHSLMGRTPSRCPPSLSVKKGPAPPAISVAPSSTSGHLAAGFPPKAGFPHIATYTNRARAWHRPRPYAPNTR